MDEGRLGMGLISSTSKCIASQFELSKLFPVCCVVIHDFEMESAA